MGILGFADKAEWILPFTPVGDGGEIQKAVRKISPGGGTDLAMGLEAAIRAFTGAEAVRRHMVIISDGMTVQADFAGFSRRLREMRVTVTTIGVGYDINEKLLRDLAVMGEGEFYRADEARLPQIIVAETFRVTRELIQEGTFRPVLRTPADFLGGLPDPSRRSSVTYVPKRKRPPKSTWKWEKATLYWRPGATATAGWRFYG